MSLYIQQENQGLIWNAIIKTPLFQQWTKSIQDPNNSDKQLIWFRQIIQQFYFQNQSKQLTVQELQQLNRETITYMLHNLKQKIQEVQSQSLQHSPFLGQTTSQTFSPILTNNNRPSMIMDTFPKSKTDQVAVTRDYILEQKQDEINREFEQRQKEYSGMLKRGPVQEIDFRLATEPDKPIENIENLIREQMARREYEIPVLPANGLLTNKYVDPEPEKSLTKKVHWSNDEIDHIIDAKDITQVNEGVPMAAAEKQNNTLQQQFRDFMMEMRAEMRALREELNDIKMSPTGPLFSSTDNITFARE